MAVAYVVYLRMINMRRQILVAFVAGGLLLTPRGVAYKGELSISRAELCAACLCSENVRQIECDLEFDLKKTQYFIGS